MASKFIMQNKWTVGFLAVSILLLLYGYVFQFGDAISPVITISRTTGWLLALLSVYIYSVKSGRTIIANLGLVAMLVVLLEIICFVLLGLPEKKLKSFDLPDGSPDHIAKNVGSVPYADSVYHSVKTNGDNVVYDVKYSFDRFSKRITPGHNPDRKQYALFFGCSVAFGEGLEDNETFAYQLQEITNNYNSYNFAYSGYGANHMLARMEYQYLPLQVDEKTGAAFYIFIWDHLYRTIGTMARYTDWMHNAPYYTIENDQLVRKKMFKDGRKFQSWFYELIYQSSIIKYFAIDLPFKLNDSHFDLVTEVIKQAETTYKWQFGNDNFYVILYPSTSNIPDEQLEMLKTYLERKNLKVVDLMHFIKYGDEYTLNGDPHPNANTNRLLVEETLRRIKL